MTVSANKREQQLGRVDAAVSVRSGEELRANDVRTVTDLQKVFPGLVIDARGNRAYANFTIRGISSPDFYNPSVQIYIDGAPQDPATFTQELVDVDRVELLRGPQGTLYGRNAFAGVINIYTRKPREQSAGLFGTVSNRLFEAGGTATGALVPDSLFLDLAIKESYYLGQIRDIDRGRDDIDWWNALNGRIGLRYAPSGGPFDANLWVAHDRLRSREEIYVLDRDVSRRIYRSSILGPYNFLERAVTTAGLSWNYRLEDVTVSSVTSVQDVDLKRKLFARDFPETDRTYYEELRFAFDNGGPLKGVAGLALWSDRFTRDAAGVPGFFGNSRNVVDSRSVGVFGEATYALTERLDLTAGARISYDWARIDFDRPEAYGNGSGLAFRRSADFTSFQPKLSLGYQIDDTTRVYALVSKGYKPGGFNHTVSSIQDAQPYRPETAWNFEVGARTAWFDGALVLSSALYHIRATDKQIYVGPVGLQVIRNVGETTSTGVEIEASLTPTDRLTLTGMATFGRSEFSQFIDPLTGLDHSGNRVPYAPDITANISARYVIEQSLIPAQVSLTAAAHAFSRTWFNEANTLSQPAFATFDAGLELAFHRGPTVKIFADNLTNEIQRTSSFDFNGAVISTIAQGRIIGVAMRTQF